MKTNTFNQSKTLIKPAVSFEGDIPIPPNVIRTGINKDHPSSKEGIHVSLPTNSQAIVSAREHLNGGNN